MGALAGTIVAAATGASRRSAGRSDRPARVAWRVAAVCVTLAAAGGWLLLAPRGGPSPRDAAIVLAAVLWIPPLLVVRAARQRGAQRAARAQSDERQSLLRVGHAAVSSLDLSVVLHEIARATLGIARIESTSIELWEPATDELVVAAQVSIPAWPGTDAPGRRYPLDRWPFDALALLGRDPVHYTVASPALSAAGRADLVDEQIGAVALFPLLIGEERFGLLKFFARDPDAFGEHELQLGQEMSVQTALAIHNARLLATERQRAEERAVLLRVTAAATASLEFYQVLNEIALATLGVAGIECTAVEIWHPESDELEIAAQVTVADWPGVDEPGTRYPVGYWERDHDLLASRESAVLDVNDPELDAASRERMIAAGTGSALVFPLWMGEQCLGVLDFFARASGAFGDAAMRLGAEIAAQTALAIHRAGLLAAEHARANEWAILHRVGRAASSSLDMREVLSEIAQASLDVAGAEACTITLWDRARNDVVIEADVALADWAESVTAPGTRFPDDTWAMERRQIETGAAIVVEVDSPTLSARESEDFTRYGIVSLALIPIIREDEKIGWLTFTARTRNAFTADTLRLGREIAVQIGLAIQNARLLEAARLSAHDWAVLHRVSRAAITSLERGDLLAEIARACLGVQGVGSCTIFSWDKTTDDLVIEADVKGDGWPDQPDPPGTRYPLLPDAAEHRAMALKTPIVVDVDDPELSAGDRRVMIEHGMTSLVLIPVWLSREEQGFVYLTSCEHGVFTTSTVKLGAEIGAQVALAIQSVRLLQESRRYAEEQSALLRVSRAISAGRDLATVMDEVALASLAIAGAECTEIELLLGTEIDTEIVASRFLPSWDHGSTPVGKRVSLADWPLTRRVLATRQPEILAPDSPDLTDYEREILFGRTVQSVLALPIALDDRGLGLMCCYAAPARAFGRDSIRLGLDLATQGAIAIDRARLHAALEEQANTDGLTGLLNHRAIQERLDAELSRAYRAEAPLAVLMIDLNHFKYVNDTRGHQAGDRVLQRIARMLTASVRNYDAVGRYGGDEFMVLLPGADTAEAIAVAERIMESVGIVRLAEGDGEPAVNLSVGLAVFPAHAATRQELIDVADRAMYQAKQRRHGQIVTGPLLLPTVAD